MLGLVATLAVRLPKSAGASDSENESVGGAGKVGLPLPLPSYTSW